MSPSQMNVAASAPPAIDLASLLGRCLGNFKMVEKVLTAFRTAGTVDLGQLQAAIDAADFGEIAEVAHRFKGSASNVSATALYEILAQIELSGRDRNDAPLATLIERLKTEWESFESYAQVFAPAAP